MARITFTQMAGGIWPADLFRAVAAPVLGDTGEVTYLTSAGAKVVLTGTGFVFDDIGQPLRGTVATVTVLSGSGTEILRMESVRASLPTLLRLATGGQSDGGLPGTGDGAAVLAHLLRGADLMTGSGYGDTLWGSLGAGAGNDTLRGGAGNDVIHGDAGADELFGGAGIDRLDYQSSYRDSAAFRGILLDAAAGTVTDCWGHADRFSQFEGYGDSAFDDSLTGSLANETWSLGAGRDVLDAGGGVDWLDYAEALSLGGRRGIVVDLEAGRVRDPFGQVDLVSGVDGVGGTARADVMRGSGGSDTFDGREGLDRFDGRGGYDRLGFWGVEDLGGHGVRIDMGAAGAQVLDDGFGNAETVLSIEAFTLSSLADSYTGAGMVDDVSAGSGDDSLAGGDGDDVLRGEGGTDVIEGGAGRDWIEGGAGHDVLSGGEGADSFVFRVWGSAESDTVQGFVSGEDRLWLVAGWRGLPMTGINARHFLSGDGVDAAVTLAQRLLYDTATGMLRYDPDGTGAQAAEVVAILSGQEDLSWRDFAILT